VSNVERFVARPRQEFPHVRVVSEPYSDEDDLAIECYLTLLDVPEAELQSVTMRAWSIADEIYEDQPTSVHLMAVTPEHAAKYYGPFVGVEANSPWISPRSMVAWNMLMDVRVTRIAPAEWRNWVLAEPISALTMNSVYGSVLGGTLSEAQQANLAEGKSFTTCDQVRTTVRVVIHGHSIDAQAVPSQNYSLAA